VGGVSERPTLVTKRRNPLTCSWSQRWKAPRFTRCRSPSRVAGETWVLVGPSCLQRGSFPCRCSHRRQQVSSGGMRRGTSSACARRTHSSPRCRTSIDAVRGHVLRSIQRPVHLTRHSVVRSFRYRGRANLRKQEEPAPGSERTEDARLAAPHRFSGQPEEVVRDEFRKGRWSWPSSLRGNESPGEVSVRRVSLQKSASSILASNKLARSAPKRVAVRVNGGLAGVAQGTQVSWTMLVNRSWRSAFIAN